MGVLSVKTRRAGENEKWGLDKLLARVYILLVPFIPKRLGVRVLTDEGFLTAVDVAKMIGVTDRQVRDLADEKIIPAYRIGKAWRFKRAEVADWHLKQRNQPLEKPAEQ